MKKFLLLPIILIIFFSGNVGASDVDGVEAGIDLEAGFQKVLNFLIYSLISTDARQSRAVIGRGLDNPVIIKKDCGEIIRIVEKNTLTANICPYEYDTLNDIRKYIFSNLDYYFGKEIGTLLKLRIIYGRIRTVTKNNNLMKFLDPHTDKFHQVIVFEYRWTF